MGLTSGEIKIKSLLTSSYFMKIESAWKKRLHFVSFCELLKWEKVVLLMFYDFRKPLRLKFSAYELSHNLNREQRACSKA